MPNSDRLPRSLSRADNPLVRAVGHIHATVQRKLLVALALVAVLLVAVGLLGLGALNASNDRVDTLGLLPPRITGYVELEFDSIQLTDQLGARDVLATCGTGVPCGATDAALLGLTDSDIKDLLFAMGTLSDLNSSQLTFVPAAGTEEDTVRKIHSETEQLSTQMTTLINGDNVITLKDLQDNQAESNEAGVLQ